MWCCAVLAVEEYVEVIVAYVMSGCCLVMGSSKVVEMRGPADERERPREPHLGPAVPWSRNCQGRDALVHHQRR